ncbi:MAG: transglutaminase family protein [Cyclobacteriaceae bacterium]
MVNLKVFHNTYYKYSEEVFLDTHHFYFYPSPRPNVRVLNFSIEIDPSPSGLTQRLDQENNFYHQSWFLGMHENLTIKTELEVEISESNPFSFLIEDKPKTSFVQPLDCYLATSYQMSSELSQWSKTIRANAGEGPIDYLSALCQKIADEWNHESRYEFDLMTPEKCFNDRMGSCRDLSWMMIQILRHEGFPARFVSGYSFNPDLGEGHELHAWVEVWLNGGGWVALDPSAGIFCNENYLPISSSYHPFNTLPVLGAFRGDAISRLDTAVEIQKL